MTLGAPLGLSSGLFWGTGDFLGGLTARRLPAIVVTFWSQLSGGLILAVVVAASGQPPTLHGIAWGAVAGVSGGTALVLFYRGLAEGTMSIVAPVSATGAVLPVVAALARGEPPSTLAGAGIAAALVGVVLVSRPARGTRPGQAGALSLRVLGFALGAALGFGLFFVLIDQASSVPGGTPLWSALAVRAGSLAWLGGIVAVRRRPLAWPGRRLVRLIALVGVLDTTANVLFAYASTLGNLAVVGVLGSLYPVATVLLARFVLAERLSGGQTAGVALTLTGVAILGAA
jgi:drug/metabolite transporter (DMT)-like permease